MGATTPTTATPTADAPTASSLSRLLSSPTWNSSRITPISAAMARKGAVFSVSKASMPVRPMLPRRMPKSSSPSTAGWFSRSISSPPSFAATRMEAMASRNGVTSPPSAPPSAAPAAVHAPKASTGTKSEHRPRRPR